MQVRMGRSGAVARGDDCIVVMIPVVGGQNLILAIAVQTVGRAVWNIQATMVECSHVGQEWAGKKTYNLTHNTCILLQMMVAVGPHQLIIYPQQWWGITLLYWVRVVSSM